MPIGAGLGTAIGAGLTAIGAIGGGVMNSRSQNHAIDAQSRANEEALAYQKQLAAEEKANKQRRLDDYNAQYEAYMRQYYPDLARKIVHPVTATGAGGTPAPMQVPGATPGGPPIGGPPMAPGAPGPMSLGSMMGAPPITDAPPMAGQTAPDATAPKSLADLGGWEDWKRYGVGA